MRTLNRRMLTLFVAVPICTALMVAFGFMLSDASRSDLGRVRRLPDGSTLQLKVVTLMMNYTFSYQSGNVISRFLGRILPFRNPWKSWSGGTLGFATDGRTNLLVITLNRFTNQIWAASVTRVALLDDGGRQCEVCWAAGTLGLENKRFQGWQFHAVPPRSRTIELHFFTEGRNSNWTNAAAFKIPNPFYGD